MSRSAITKFFLASVKRLRSSMLLPLILGLLLLPASRAEGASCWRVIDWATNPSSPTTTANLQSADCSQTPSGYGWAHITLRWTGGTAPSPPPDLYLLIQSSDPRVKAGVLAYNGQDSSGVPIIVHDFIPGPGSSGTQLSSQPPAAAQGFLPGTLTLGGAPGNHSGAYGFDAQKGLMRIYNDQGTWKCETVPVWGSPIETGSLISGEKRIYAVNQAGHVVNTYLDGNAVKFGILGEQVSVAPGSLALGGSVDENTGVYAVTPAGSLVRAWWEGSQWKFETVPQWGGKIVPGSLIPGERRVYAVNESGHIVNTYPDGGSIKFGILGDKVSVVPGSLALGGSVEANSGVYAVTPSGALLRAWWAGSQWSFETVQSWGGKIVPGSLIPGPMRVFGVTDEGRIFNTYMDGSTVKFGIVRDTTDTLPGSLALGGPLNAETGVYSVDKNKRLVRSWWQNQKWNHETYAGAFVRENSLVSGDKGVFGVDAEGRAFVSTLGGAALKILHPCGKVFVRRSVATLSAQEIESLRKGVKAMMARPSADPTSWSYQANIHGTTQPPPLPKAWASCQHGTSFFLSWHRMYLYYFERILRAASGDPDLTLPYWNYNDSAQRALPVPFRTPADPVSNPLFIPDRGTGANQGAQLPASAVAQAKALGYTSFSWLAGTPGGFSDELEQQPHNPVHTVLGGWMGGTSTAGRDPIFWLHHANIDRLWNVWMAQGSGRKNPTSSGWLNTSFTFFDETGKEVQLTGKQILDTVGQLEYRYDDEVLLLKAPPPPAAPPSPEPEGPRGAPRLPGRVPQGKTVLGARRVSVLLSIPRSVRPLISRALAGESRRRLVLQIEGITFDQAPEVYYEVYVNLPAGQAPDFQSAFYAGNLSFFGLGGGHAGHGAGAARGDGRRRFDVTSVARQLRSRKLWKEESVSVTLVPRGLIQPRGSTATPAPVRPVQIRRIAIVLE